MLESVVSAWQFVCVYVANMSIVANGYLSNPVIGVTVYFLCMLPVFMVINRVRGGGMEIIQDIPGRTLIYTSLVTNLLAFPFFGLSVAVVAGIGNFLWGMLGWGLWFDLDRDNDEQASDSRWNNWFEKSIWAISFNTDYLAFFWRNALMIIPTFLAGFLLLGTPWYISVAGPIVFGALMVLCYEISWQLTDAVALGEILGGIPVWMAVYAIGIFSVV